MDFPHAAALLFSLSLLLRPSSASAPTPAHPFNITDILDKNETFSIFNHQLTATNLSADINDRRTITVCAVNNDGMQAILSQNLATGDMRNLLSLHVLVDYFDTQKLHNIANGVATVSTMFQATGLATGTSGLVNITDLKGGKVQFTTQDGNGKVASSDFVIQVFTQPYNISIIQIKNLFNSSEAAAPAPAPTPVNLTAHLSDHGCKAFAKLLASSSAQGTFNDNAGSGLTIFCPGDGAISAFTPKFNNLTAEGKVSLLEYHGIPTYQTMTDLKSKNGEVKTLATDGGKSDYEFKVQNNGENVTIETKVVTANILSTAFDLPRQVIIYKLDKVLLPVELFGTGLAPSPSPSPAPAPAPGPGAKSPRAARHASPPAPPSDDTPSDTPADAPAADQNTRRGAAAKFNGGGVFAVILGLLVILQL